MTDVPPVLPNFYLDGEPHLTPLAMWGTGWPEEIAIRPVVVAAFSDRLTEFLVARTGARPCEQWPRPLGQLYTNETFSIVTLPVGAPAAVMVAEELAALGMEVLLVVGAAGSLQPDLPIGSSALPTAAVREEGTSYHYLPPEAAATASEDLVQLLDGAARRHHLEPRRGLNWTTDAPYREHREKIAAFRDGGVLTVDMELSALFVLAQHRGIRCAGLLGVSDELYEPWRLGWSTPELAEVLGRAGLAAIDVAAALAAGG